MSEIPICSYFEIRPLCHTLSKAELMLKTHHEQFYPSPNMFLFYEPSTITEIWLRLHIKFQTPRIIISGRSRVPGGG